MDQHLNAAAAAQDPVRRLMARLSARSLAMLLSAVEAIADDGAQERRA